MSMIGHLLKVTPDELAEMLDDPDVAHAKLYPEDGAYPGASRTLDLDKSWHLIHFLLTVDTSEGKGPLSGAVLGGETLEGTDAGYGPFRYHEPPEVKKIAEALRSVTGEELWARFDAKQVAHAEVYPSAWEGGSDDKDYICQNFEALKEFYVDASNEGVALLLYIA